MSGEKTEIFWYFAKPAAEGGSDASKTFWGLKRGIIWLKMEEQNVKMVFLQKKTGGWGLAKDFSGFFSPDTFPNRFVQTCRTSE